MPDWFTVKRAAAGLPPPETSINIVRGWGDGFGGTLKFSPDPVGPVLGPTIVIGAPADAVQKPHAPGGTPAIAATFAENCPPAAGTVMDD